MLLLKLRALLEPNGHAPTSVAMVVYGLHGTQAVQGTYPKTHPFALCVCVFFVRAPF